MRKQLYLILREDLAYKYVQGGHALAQFALEHPLAMSEWNNGHLICLSVFNGKALEKVHGKLVLKKEVDGYVTFSKFTEPDLMSDLPTALAVYEDGSGFASKAVSGLKMSSR